MKKHIHTELIEHSKLIEEILFNHTETIEEIARRVVNCYENNGKMVLFGNGGSAADAQHIAAEMVGRYLKERKSLPAMALTTNSSVVTAIGNDYSYDMIFSRQVESLVTDKDVVIGISTSGNSENVIQGIIAAKTKGAKTIAFTGRSGGKMKELVDVLLAIPSDHTPRIQEAHILVAHIICGIVEGQLFHDEEKHQEQTAKSEVIGA